MKKFNKANKGFTLVELLVTIVIIGILLGLGIAAVLHFIDRARNEQVKSNKEALIMAAKNYLQENRGLLPKNVGETTTVPVSVLKDSKYITDDITNYKKESCMENSFVAAKKDSASKYTYKAYLYCGSEVPTEVVAANTPFVKIDFVDANGNKYDTTNPSITQDVSNAKFVIRFLGDDKGKNTPIDGYSYSILIMTGDDKSLHEVYNSGTISANRASEVYIDRDNNLADYIDITTQTTVVIKATVRNVDGGVNNVVSYFGGDANQAQLVYLDNKVPVCGKVTGEPGEENWINIGSTEERKITVSCSDGNGSGCIRANFTKTYNSGSYKTDSIQIKDNAGNTTDCEVLVNIDKGYPVIELEAYARGKKEDAITGNDVITGNRSTSNGYGVLNPNEYDKLVSGYMSKANYPYGVIYKVTLRDTIGIDGWEWKVNPVDIGSTSDQLYNEVGSSGEATRGNCNKQESCTIYVNLFDSGLRKGVLTVKDIAGNTSTFDIYANINRNAPGAPTITNSSTGNSTGDWTSENVSLTLKLENSGLSGIGDYYYSYNEEAVDRTGVNDSDADTKWVIIPNGHGQQEFTASIWNFEINKRVYIIACDILGNCSDSNSTSIKIDRTAPTGLNVTGYKKTSSSDITDYTGLQTINSDTWHKGWLLVTPSGAKDSGSGGIYYLLTVTGASENVEDVKQKYRNVDAQGISYVSYKACDAVGNCSVASTFKAKLDRTGPIAPSISNSSGGNWTKSNVTLNITGTTDSGAPLDKFYYTYSSSPSGNGNNPETNWVEMSEGTNQTSFSKTWSNSTDINKKVRVKVCDSVGNCSSATPADVKIDNTPPDTPVISNPTNGDWTNTDFSVVLTSSDHDGSGLADYQYTYKDAQNLVVGDDADENWKSNGLPAVEEYTSRPFSVERDQNVYWRVCDALDNCSSRSSTRIRIDKTKPTCGTLTITTNDSEAGVSGTIGCSDDDSKCTNNTFSFGPFTETSNAVIRDVAGNTKNCSVTVTSYDCSTFGAWKFWYVYPTSNNNCPTTTSSYEYEFDTCPNSSNNYRPDLCESNCNSACGSNDNCRKTRYCCVRRRRNEKTCYTH